jgi:hypothetical protein
MEAQSGKEYRTLNIPRQDFKSQRPVVRPFLSKDIQENLRRTFDLFAEDDRVNPHDIQSGLRLVGMGTNYNL